MSEIDDADRVDVQPVVKEAGERAKLIVNTSRLCAQVLVNYNIYINSKYLRLLGKGNYSSPLIFLQNWSEKANNRTSLLKS